jgi:hypothetical protein
VQDLWKIAKNGGGHREQLCQQQKYTVVKLRGFRNRMELGLSAYKAHKVSENS